MIFHGLFIIDETILAMQNYFLNTNKGQHHYVSNTLLVFDFGCFNIVYFHIHVLMIFIQTYEYEKDMNFFYSKCCKIVLIESFIIE